METDDRQSSLRNEEYPSIPKRPQNGTVPSNILEFSYSFAYDCRKYFNLCVADQNTIIFASGNFIHFFDVQKKKISLKGSCTGGGIGHICRNPVFGHIAIGENGFKPLITIYSWPAMEQLTVLTEGTTRRYFHLAYSPDGLLLVSQGGHPDFFITIWNWQQSSIALRCKSYVQDVFNVTFSKTIPGSLTSAGSGHIKFWKMAETFTGLKLKGETGRFGKTEISDIIAIYPMPDETVISGCEWGNILLWEEGLIKLEICRKNKQSLHSAFLSQFEYINGELASVGTDGWIKFWFYESIDHANPTDDANYFELQSIYELQIKESDSRRNAMIMSIEKRDADDPESTFWYAQDGNGGIWSIDLDTVTKSEPSKKILTCHAGPILDASHAVWGTFIATIDDTGRVHFYDYSKERLIIAHKFHDSGRRIIWLPCEVEPSGSCLVCGFASGVIRLITVSILSALLRDNINGDYVRLLQVLKPHTKPISAMSTNLSSSLLVTASEDSTIFCFSLRSTDKYPEIVPIGYINLPSTVTSISWNPCREETVLLGCSKGHCVQVELHREQQDYTKTSYELIQCQLKTFRFKSVKSSVKRKIIQEEQDEKKKWRLAKRKEEMENLRAENPGLVIDEQAFLTDIEEDPPLPELFIPDEPNSILVLDYSNQGTIWLLMSGFDAGFSYEYSQSMLVTPRRKILKKDNENPDKTSEYDQTKDRGLELIQSEELQSESESESEEEIEIEIHGGEIEQFEEIDDAEIEPIRCTEIPAAIDTEITRHLHYKNKKYLILGTKNGEILVCKMRMEDPTDLSDYWSLPVHDYYNGFISKIVLGCDQNTLLTCGHDGNIFSFVVNDDEEGEVIEIPKATDPLEWPAKDVEDIEDLDHPSMEEVIIRAERNQIAIEAAKKRETTLQILRDLTEDYNRIVKRNDSLAPSQQVTDLELDPRITKDLQEELKARMNMTQEKLAFRVEKSKLEVEKLLAHFVESVTCLPFAVRGILNEDRLVHSLREEKAEFAGKSSRKMQQAWQGTGTSREKEETVTEYSGGSEQRANIYQSDIEHLIHGKYLTNFTVYGGIGIQINQLLAKYREKWERNERRGSQLEAMHRRKPNLGKAREQDSILLEETRRAIGEYYLKSSGLAKTDKYQESAASKFKQLLDYRMKLHYVREDFNKNLRLARSKKEELLREVFKITEILGTIHAEIPAKNIKLIPPMPTMPTADIDVEYPEQNLELEKYVTMAEKMLQAKQQKQSIIIHESRVSDDQEFEALFIGNRECVEADSVSSIFSPSKIKIKDDALRVLEKCEVLETTCEKELKRRRRARKIYEQDCLLKRVEENYKRFDDQLLDLDERRVDISLVSAYMELLLLTIYEEFLILEESEEAEDVLVEKVTEKEGEITSLKKQIERTTNKLRNREETIKGLQSKMKDLSSEYLSAVRDNKFHNFLYRIFRKKYAPPNPENGSADTSSESSDSSSESSENGENSDLVRVVYDESICPPGCDRDLYDLAFSMRERRYSYELEIREEQKELEGHRREIENDTRHLKILENHLKSSLEELESFKIKKQTGLNDIDATVLIKFHQLQHISDTGIVPDLKDCVVFYKKQLSDLYDRVGELQKESEELEKRRKIKQDCKYMVSESKKLEAEIKEEMVKKFGTKTSLMALYENTLYRMIHDCQSNPRDTMKTMMVQINDIRNRCETSAMLLEDLIRNNTEKLSFLTVLEEEKTKLQKSSKKTLVSEEKISKKELEVLYEKDVGQLKEILGEQEERKKLLQNEIRSLRMKGREVPLICPNQINV